MRSCGTTITVGLMLTLVLACTSEPLFLSLSYIFLDIMVTKAFLLGALGSTVFAGLWIKIGMHTAASKLRAKAYAKADQEYKEMGGF